VPDKMDLTFRVDASEDAFLVMKLCFVDHWNTHNPTSPGTTLDQDHFLKELYFTMKNLGCTGIDLRVGKQVIPFGMDKDELALHPYLDGYQRGAMNTRRNGFNYITEGGTFSGRPFENIGHTIWYDRMFALIPSFKIGDKAKLELAMFQNRYDNARTNATNNRFTDDPGFSFSARAVFKPIEDLELSAGAITRYNRAFRNGTARIGVDTRPINAAGGRVGVDPRNVLDRTDRMYGSSLAFDWNPTLFCKKVNLFTEWQHGWNPEFVKHTSSDIIHTGISLAVTDACKLFAQYEWARSRAKQDGDRYHEQMQRAIFAAQRTFEGGLYAELGYQKEWGHQKGFGSPNRSANADTVYTATGWVF